MPWIILAWTLRHRLCLQIEVKSYLVTIFVQAACSCSKKVNHLVQMDCTWRHWPPSLMTNNGKVTCLAGLSVNDSLSQMAANARSLYVNEDNSPRQMDTWTCTPSWTTHTAHNLLPSAFGIGGNQCNSASNSWSDLCSGIERQRGQWCSSPELSLRGHHPWCYWCFWNSEETRIHI